MSQAKDSVKINNNYKWFIGVVLVLILFFSIGALVVSNKTPEDYRTPEQINLMISNAISDAILSKDTEIAGLKGQIETLKIQAEEPIIPINPIAPIEPILESGYLIDEIELEETISKELSDRELNLFDGKIDFDGEDYDAEEVFTLDSLELTINEEDFKDNAYLSIPEGSISYKMNIEAGLNRSEINDEDSLIFELLGEEVEITNWDGSEITILKGEEYFVEEGETAGGVIVLMVLEDAIYVEVDGIQKKIDEGKTKKVGNLEIKAKEVLYVSHGDMPSKAIILVGIDIEKTITDGEEYLEDSIWNWEINSDSIGIVLNTEFIELDDDYKVLDKEEMVCLPNDYLCVRYNGLVEEDTETYDFEIDTKSGNDYVEVKGNFQKGLKDYSKIYINSSGIYDKDLELIDLTSINLGSTDLELELGSKLKINKVELDLDLLDVLVDSVSISSNEDNYLTPYGIVIENPEDSCEDENFKIIIPQEQTEGSISII